MLEKRGFFQANPNLFFIFFFTFFRLFLIFCLLIYLFSIPGKHYTKELHSSLLLKSITFHIIPSPVHLPVPPCFQIWEFLTMMPLQAILLYEIPSLILG